MEAKLMLELLRTWPCRQSERDAADLIESLQAQLDAANEKLRVIAEQKPVAYGIPNTAITGKSQPMMTLHHERCGQYPEIMVPLFAQQIMPVQDVIELPNYEHILFDNMDIQKGFANAIEYVGEILSENGHKFIIRGAK